MNQGLMRYDNSDEVIEIRFETGNHTDVLKKFEDAGINSTTLLNSSYIEEFYAEINSITLLNSNSIEELKDAVINFKAPLN